MLWIGSVSATEQKLYTSDLIGIHGKLRCGPSVVLHVDLMTGSADMLRFGEGSKEGQVSSEPDPSPYHDQRWWSGSDRTIPENRYFLEGCRAC